MEREGRVEFENNLEFEKISDTAFVLEKSPDSKAVESRNWSVSMVMEELGKGSGCLA